MTEQFENPGGFAAGGVQWTLRFEGLVVFALAVAAYWQLGGALWVFLVLFLWPDLAFLAFLIDSRLGVLVYDGVHSTIGPLLLGAGAYVAGRHAPLLFALIWLAHIGIDRFLGYGLRYPRVPAVTHLGPKGPPQKSPGQRVL